MEETEELLRREEAQSHAQQRALPLPEEPIARTSGEEVLGSIPTVAAHSLSRYSLVVDEDVKKPTNETNKSESRLNKTLRSQ